MAAMTQIPSTPSGADQPLTTIGDIGVSHTSVWLPTGQHPVRGTTWVVSDMSRQEEKISTVGIVLAIVGMFLICILSLLFLLLKDKQTTGYIQVTVQGDGFHHATMIPATSPATFAQVMQQVNWARGLAAAA
jgi:hypothetical protein